MRIEIENISEDDFYKVQQEVAKALLSVYKKIKGFPIGNTTNQLEGFYFDVF